MATLTGRTIASSYEELIKFTSGSGATGTLDTVEDGNATPTALQLSTGAIKSLGTLSSTGNLDVNTDKFTVNATSGNTTVAGTLGVTGVTTGTGGFVGDLTGDIKSTDGTQVLDNGTDGTDATFTGTATKANQLATARNLELTGDVTGNVDFNGTADVDISSTLSSSGVTAGTYGSATKSPRFTVDAKGRVTGVSEVTITGGGGGGGGANATSIQDVGVSSTDPTSGEALVYDGSEYAPTNIITDAETSSTNTASRVVKRDSSGDFAAGTITAALSGNASTATAWATGRTVSLSGDVTGSATGVDGTGNVTISSTIADLSPSPAGTDKGSATKTVTLTVNAKGQVTALSDQDISIPASQVSDAGTAATKNAADAEWNANKLQGRTLASDAPSDGQTIAWNNSSSQWEPTTGAAANAIQLQGRSIQNVAPTDKYPLVWDSTDNRWEPSQVESGGIADNAVTDAKLADMTGYSVKGRAATGSGDPADIALSASQVLGRLSGNVTGIALGIADDNVVQVDGASNAPVNGDYARWTANGVEGRTASEARTDLGLEIGTDVQAYDADTAKTDVNQAWSGIQRSPFYTSYTDDTATFYMLNAQNWTWTVTASGVSSVTFELESTESALTDANGQSGFILLTNSGGTITLNATTTDVDTDLLTTISGATGTFLLSYICDGSKVYLTNSKALS